MKKNLSSKTILICSIVYLIISIISIYFGFTIFADKYYQAIGSEAQDIATVISKSIELSNDDVTRLKNIDYSTMFDSDPKNIELKTMIENSDFLADIRYIYLEMLLDEDEIKYYVTNETTDFFNAPTETPLNAMWLLDVYIGEYPAEIYTSGKLMDIYRYCVAEQSDIEIITEKLPAYHFSSDGWGYFITGYAPFFTTQGDYVGMFAVDINYGEYMEYRNNIIAVLIGIVLFSNILLCGLFMLLYRAYKNATRKHIYEDALTEIYNRRYYNEWIERAVGEAYRCNSPLSIIMLDIDFFKKYNDEFGHLKGDDCLHSIAQAIKGCLNRPMDTVSRYGGEEFVVVLPNTDKEGAQAIIKNIFSAVDSLNLVCGGKKLTLSAGLCTLIPDGSKKYLPDKLTYAADNALYLAKNNGRDRFEVFDFEE